MSKFKSGDKVVCVAKTLANGVVLGGRYTIDDPNYLSKECSEVRVTLKELPDVSPYETRFELAIQDDPVVDVPVLTSHEVFQYYAEGRESELECWFESSASWKSGLSLVSIESLRRRKFRVKAKTVDYYGTQLPAPVVLVNMDKNRDIYSITNGAVIRNTVQTFLAQDPQNPLVFSTREQAQLVLETIYQPFR